MGDWRIIDYTTPPVVLGTAGPRLLVKKRPLVRIVGLCDRDISSRRQCEVDPVPT